MVRVRDPYKKSKGGIGSMCKWLLIPVLLVSFIFLYSKRPRAEKELNPNTTKKWGGVRGSEDAAAETTPSPTQAPTPPPIEVKSHEEVQQHINGGGGSFNDGDGGGDGGVTSSGNSHPPAHFYTEDTAEIMFQDFTYRFPSQHFHNFSQYDGNVVVGVLSAPQHVSRRETIRKTWAYQRSNVFFLVAGTWDEIAEEIRLNRDIFWIDAPEAMSSVAIKSLAFVSAAKKYLTFRYILKADDDSYIRLSDIETEASRTSGGDSGAGTDFEVDVEHDSDDGSDQSVDSDDSDDGSGDGEANMDIPSTSGAVHWSDFDYIGSCVMSRPIEYDNNPHGKPGIIVPSVTAEFPTYATGAGYLISSNFATCFARVAQNAPMLSTVEDANTGLFAQACHVPCQHSDRFLNFPEPTITLPSSQSDYVVAHYLEHYQNKNLEETMITLHTHSCSRDEADPVSCGDGSLRLSLDAPYEGGSAGYGSQPEGEPQYGSEEEPADDAGYGNNGNDYGGRL